MGENPPPLLYASQSWDPSLSATASKRQEFPPLPLYRQTEEERQQSNDLDNHRHHHVTFASETGAEASPDLHTLVGHNIWAEKSGTKTLANATENGATNDENMFAPGYRRARGPLKKRFSPPGPYQVTASLAARSSNPPSILRSQTSSSVFNNSNSSGILPLLRQATSALMLQQGGRLPPGLRFHPSIGEGLISDPLVETPYEYRTLAKQSLPSVSSFQPRPSMAFTPAAEALVALKSSREVLPVVTNRSDSADGVFGRETPFATLLREESSTHSLASDTVNTKNREGALAVLHASGTVNYSSASNKMFHAMHPFSASSRGRIRGPPRRPYFSPMPTAEKKKKNEAQERDPSAAAVLDTAKAPKPQKKRVVRGHPTKAKYKKKGARKGSNALGGKNQGQMGTIVSKRTLFEDVPVSNRSCKCGTTNCLKLYCECFHSAMFCDPVRCRCHGCKNLEAYNSVSEPKGDRVQAILSILSRRPQAFVHGGRKAVADREGCRCQRSG
jgi:Tesmin/TSO1-like CXC domain, cysteine-rich domain